MNVSCYNIFPLFDEATSALDNVTSYHIEKMILDLEGVTVLAVTHKLNEDLVKRYDRIIHVENGRIVST